MTRSKTLMTVEETRIPGVRDTDKGSRVAHEIHMTSAYTTFVIHHNHVADALRVDRHLCVR